MATTRESDTGHYNHAGEEWYVVQRADGGVVCHSARYMTAANKATWEAWKRHGWERSNDTRD